MQRRWGWLVAGGLGVGLVVVSARWASLGEVRNAGAVRVLYDRLAPSYDVAAWVFQPIGGRKLRDRAVDLLQIRPGDTVVDLGCGTGVNLPVLSERVGTAGRVIGVDLSSGMLEQARRRAEDLGLGQVTLVQADMRDFRVPPGTTAVLATASLEMVPEHEAVIGALAERFAGARGRIAVLGFRRPETWPTWAIALARMATALFGVTRAYEQIMPWQSLRRHFEQIHYEEALGGALYLAVGRAAPDTSRAHLEPTGPRRRDPR